MAQAERTIVVTGGSGKLGRAVVRDLAGHGLRVVNLDRVPNPDRDDPHGPYADGRAADVITDLSDYGQVASAMSGIDERVEVPDAVVHLGAIPAPGLRPNAATFANNVPATYNVLTAARAAGVRDIVTASSETTLGLPFDTPPPYAPVDEEYFPRPESTYSLGKLVDETVAAQLCRWDAGLKICALRFSNVMYPEDYAEFDSWQDDASVRKWNLWGYIDARDGAQAVRRALDLPERGFEAFVIANADTVMRRDSAELLDEVFPDVPRHDGISGRQTLLSIEKARRILGYEPEHSWTDAR